MSRMASCLQSSHFEKQSAQVYLTTDNISWYWHQRIKMMVAIPPSGVESVGGQGKDNAGSLVVGQFFVFPSVF